MRNLEKYPECLQRFHVEWQVPTYTVCPRIGFTRGNKFLFLILRKNFRGITFFASSETPISVIKISVLIHCILKLTFFVQIWTFLIQCWTGFCHIITKFNEKFPNSYVSGMGVQKLKLRYRVE
jgi:hypothetical protein